MDNLDKIFRAYDVRGVYPQELDETIAYKIGRATARFLKTKEIIVGRDNRSSSDSLFKCLCEGIRDEGVDVIDIGLVISPMLYWATAENGHKGGIMITASHNPSDHNGFKIIKKEAVPVGGDSGLKKIKKLVKKEKFKDKKRGNIKKVEIFKKYIEDVLKSINPKNIKPLKIFADYSGGTADRVIPELFKNLPVGLTDSLSEKIDFGISVDRDGDRILFIDEKKQEINPDLITALLIHYFFKDAGKILYTAIASRGVKEEIEKNGNIPICSRVGHTFIKEKMEKEKISFGFESSGHYYFGNKYVLESPLNTLLKVMEIVSQTQKPISDLIKPFQKYYQERFDFKTGDFWQIIKKLEKEFKKMGARHGRPAKIYRIDGLTVEYPDWWFNLRQSNTESVVRLTIEAKTKKLLEEKKQKISQIIRLN